MGKTGREGLKRKVQLFKVDRLEIELAEQAKEMICEFSKEQIHDTSAGAATFYVWVRKSGINIDNELCFLFVFVATV